MFQQYQLHQFLAIIQIKRSHKIYVFFTMNLISIKSLFCWGGGGCFCFKIAIFAPLSVLYFHNHLKFVNSKIFQKSTLKWNLSSILSIFLEKDFHDSKWFLRNLKESKSIGKSVLLNMLPHYPFLIVADRLI